MSLVDSPARYLPSTSEYILAPVKAILRAGPDVRLQSCSQSRHSHGRAYFFFFVQIRRSPFTGVFPAVITSYTFSSSCSESTEAVQLTKRTTIELYRSLCSDSAFSTAPHRLDNATFDCVPSCLPFAQCLHPPVLVSARQKYFCGKPFYPSFSFLCISFFEPEAKCFGCGKTYTYKRCSSPRHTLNI